MRSWRYEAKTLRGAGAPPSPIGEDRVGTFDPAGIAPLDRDLGTQEEIAPVVATLRRAGGLDVAGIASDELSASIESRMASLGVTSCRDYADRLDRKGSEYTSLLRDLLARTNRRRLDARMLEAQTRVLHLLSSGAELDEVLTKVVHETEHLSPGVRCGILLVDVGGGSLRTGPAPSMPEGLGAVADGLTIGPAIASCGAAAFLGRRVVVEDVSTHPNWEPYAALGKEFGFRGCWSEPFFSSHGEVLGTLATYITEARGPTEEEIAVVEGLCPLAGMSVERKRIVEELRTARDQLELRVQERTERLELANADLRRLSSEMLMAEERERRRLSVDLHDGLSQTLALAGVKLGEARRVAEDVVTVRIREVEGLIAQACRVVRSLTFQLSPPVLHDLGLVPALKWLAEDMQGSYGLSVVVEDDGAAFDLDSRSETTLFRAVRELLINVTKHASATEARVRVSMELPFLHVEVADDGVSFDPETVPIDAHGLFGIRERLQYLGGKMEIESRNGSGTRVLLSAPLTGGET